MLIQFKLNTSRISNKKNLLEWREGIKEELPKLYILHCTANGVPMTQVSVERLFSSMKFTFSDLRADLSPSLLEAILLIRCNGLFQKPLKKKPKRSRTKKTLPPE